MGKYILALHAGQNASACIGDASGLIYAIQEERLTNPEMYEIFKAFEEGTGRCVILNTSFKPPWVSDCADCRGCSSCFP